MNTNSQSKINCEVNDLLDKHTELDVYRKAFQQAMRIFEVSKHFPIEERYSLTDQIRRSSRLVCANLAGAWRRRRSEDAFVGKLSDGDAEAGQTQVWIQFAVEAGYLDHDTGRELYKEYDSILAMLGQMMNQPEKWLLKKKP